MSTVERSRREVMLLDLCHQAQEQRKKIEKAKEPYAEAQAEATRLKKIVEKHEDELDEIHEQIDRLTIDAPGTPIQTSLFGVGGDPAPKLPRLPSKVAEDPAVKAPLSALGLPAKQIEIMEQQDIKTVAQLEQLIASDAWWFKKFKGIGAKKVDGITDAITKWRASNPVPTAEPETVNPIADDPRISEGIYVEGVETYKLTIPEVLQATAEVRCVKTLAGTWIGAAVSNDAQDPAEFAEPLTPTGVTEYGSKQEAVAGAVERIVAWWQTRLSKTAKRMKELTAYLVGVREFLLNDAAEARADKAAEETPTDAKPTNGTTSIDPLTGEFTGPFEYVSVPVGIHGIEAQLRIVHSAGKWFGGWMLTIHGKLKSPPVGPKSPQNEDRNELVVFLARILGRELRQTEGLDPRTIEAGSANIQAFVEAHMKPPADDEKAA